MMQSATSSAASTAPIDAGLHPLVDGIPPDWATGWGRDRYGVYGEFSVGEVTQRLRWIQPGRFRMGSPEGEAGHVDWEGPQHDVVVGSGFWLFDTPCTQALWQAVTGANPSRFQSPTRPVEQVSFEDVQDFLQRLNERVPGLKLSLPSEAQWEYACRVGTETVTYAGELLILGENNAPVLDAIAWYSGNSGVGYDLEDGEDSSGWPEKQHAHTWAGTRPVGQKQPNGWGLYDMLGNVWEWCADHWHANYESAPTDGSAWLASYTDGVAQRVVRGGSWSSYARYVRAAYRRGLEPEDRHGFLGFRGARVQGVSGVAERRRAGEGGAAGRSEQAAGAGSPLRESDVGSLPPELQEAIRRALIRCGIVEVEGAALTAIARAACLTPADADARISVSRLFLGVLDAATIDNLVTCRMVDTVIAREPSWQHAVGGIRRMFPRDGSMDRATDRARAGFSPSSTRLLKRALATGDGRRLTVQEILASFAAYLIEKDGRLSSRLRAAGVDPAAVGRALSEAMGPHSKTGLVEQLPWWRRLWTGRQRDLDKGNDGQQQQQ